MLVEQLKLLHTHTHRTVQESCSLKYEATDPLYENQWVSRRMKYETDIYKIYIPIYYIFHKHYHTRL